jgi:Lrp/AsnC family leucine-responsive transcriptional regulator
MISSDLEEFMKDPSATDLDRIDMKILRALHAEGRLTNAELASRVGVSPATCHRRTRRLFDEGHIRGVRAEVAPASVDLGALVIVGVMLDRSTPDSRYTFEKAVLKVKEVLDCILVAGEFDYFLKIRARDMADFNKLQGQTLIALPGVRNTRTFFVMREVKENARLPF